MGRLADRLAGMSAERRLFALEVLGQHLHLAGERDELQDLLCDREWFEAQRAFDPSYQTYAADVDRGIELCELDDGALSGLILLTLLRSTLGSLIAKPPAAAIRSMARAGSHERATFFAGQRPDAASQFTAFVEVALAELSAGNRIGAAETLSLAESLLPEIKELVRRAVAKCTVVSLAFRIHGANSSFVRRLEEAAADIKGIENARAVTHANANLAVVAGQIGAATLRQEAVAEITRLYQRFHKDQRYAFTGSGFNSKQNVSWDVARFCRKFDLYAAPEYVIAMALWDQGRKSWTLGEELMPAVLLKRAYEFKDGETINKVIEIALSQDPEQSHVGTVPVNGQLMEALGEVGQVEAALTLISRHLAFDPDAQTLREGLARGAGRRGDTAAVQRASEPIKAADIKIDMGDRLWRLKQRVEQKLMVGGGKLLGLGDVERLSVLMAGHEAMLISHPEQAAVLWQIAMAHDGRLWKRMVRDREGISGPEERLQLGIVDRLARISRRLPGGDQAADELIDETLDVLIFAGQFDRAATMAAQIKTDDIRWRVLGRIGQELVDRGHFERAAAVADQIGDVELRGRLVEALAEKSAGQRGETAAAALGLVMDRADQLHPGERLVQSTALDSLLLAYGEGGHAADLIAPIEKLGAEAVTASLAGLGRAAVAGDEMALAAQILRIAENHKPSPESVTILASMAEQWSAAPSWRHLSDEAYRSAVKHQEALEHLEQPGVMPALARAARSRGERPELMALTRSIKRNQNGLAHIRAPHHDRALGHIAAGLTPFGEPFKHEVITDLPALQAISDDQIRAWALAQMATEIDKVPVERFEPARLSNLADRVAEKAFSLFGVDDDLGEQETRSIHRDGFLDNGLRLLRKRPPGATVPIRPSGGQTKIKLQPPFIKPAGGAEAQWRQAALSHSKLVEAPIMGAIANGALLAEMVEIYARYGRFNDLPTMAKAAKYQIDLPLIVTAAVRELVKANRPEEAAAAAAAWGEGGRFTAAQIALAGSMPERKAQKLLSRHLAAPWDEQLLAAYAGVAAPRSAAARRRLMLMLLRPARRRPRAQTLLALGIAPRLTGGLLSPVDWRRTIEQMLIMELWWR